MKKVYMTFLQKWTTLIRYIKHICRNNTYYVKYCQTTINATRYFIKNFVLYIQKYQLKLDKEVHGNTVYFIFDPKQSHPGLADRLKVIVCAYWIAKINGYDFKVISDTFQLPKYLHENKVKWIGAPEDLSYSIQNSRLLAYNGSGKIPKLNKRIKQYHIVYYIGRNIMVCNQISNWESLWHQCFGELFVWSDHLITCYQALHLINKRYVSAHLRFVNALEKFEDGHYNTIPKQKQDELINNCLKELKNIQKRHDIPLIVFSDSNIFLTYAKQAGFQSIGGFVGHISYIHNEDIELKTFLDFYAISQSQKAYRIVKPHMYQTMFSYYAAVSSNIEIETIM